MDASANQGVIRIGCAGWSIPRDSAELFGASGSVLQRYATRLLSVEINSSFYRPHRPQTYARWADSVPADFRFSVKMPKEITHTLQLQNATQQVAKFLNEANALGNRFGCLLVQLPPRLAFNAVTSEAFFAQLRNLCPAAVVCEPRHASWFTAEANQLLASLDIGRVAADPPLHPGADQPGGCFTTQYYRLHGSPKTYYSTYSAEYLSDVAIRLVASRRQSQQTWCIFDNTALGFATANALQLQALIKASASCPSSL